ncbi:MAG: GNAT family protein [bacterium]|nr:GNAT family protein [bacterium]
MLRLAGRRVTLVPFGPDRITERHVAWLNDPEVNAYSRRKGARSTAEDASRYVSSLRADEHVLAILVGGEHVGNVKLGPIDGQNACAAISILVGERAVWGQGIGAEAIYYLVSRHLLTDVGLNRVHADSCNPAFLRLVDKLGWRVEGVLRERVRLQDRFLDDTVISLLAREFRVIDAFEPPKTIS